MSLASIMREHLRRELRAATRLEREREQRVAVVGGLGDERAREHVGEVLGAVFARHRDELAEAASASVSLSADDTW